MPLQRLHGSDYPPLAGDRFAEVPDGPRHDRRLIVCHQCQIAIRPFPWAGWTFWRLVAHGHGSVLSKQYETTADWVTLRLCCVPAGQGVHEARPDVPANDPSGQKEQALRP